MITLRLVVDPADALVETADELRQVALGDDLGPLEDDPAAGGKVAFVRPPLARQGAGEEALAEAADRRVVREDTGFVCVGYVASFRAPLPRSG